MKAIPVLLALCCLLTACSQRSSDYADDLPCAEIAETAERQFPLDFGYEAFGSEHLSIYFDDRDTDDCCLRYSTLSEDINEFGVFHTPEGESVKETEQMCREYLDELWEEKQVFIASYAPEELPKLKDAEVRSFGRYTVYAILDEDDRSLLFDTVEKTVASK
jgi:hypothetical protein